MISVFHQVLLGKSCCGWLADGALNTVSWTLAQIAEPAQSMISSSFIHLHFHLSSRHLESHMKQRKTTAKLLVMLCSVKLNHNGKYKFHFFTHLNPSICHSLMYGKPIKRVIVVTCDGCEIVAPALRPRSLYMDRKRTRKGVFH